MHVGHVLCPTYGLLRIATPTPQEVSKNLRYKGFRFFFFSNEGIPLEPVHVHVRQGGASAKFWLRPEVRLADSHGFDASTLRELAGVVEKQRDLIERIWNERFGHLTSI